jgi:hypothetical protein
MNLDELLEWPPWKCFVMDSYLTSVRGFTGIGFNKERAEGLLVRIEGEMLEIEQTIEPQLPARPLNKGELDKYRLPAKPFKKDGSLSSSMINWMERLGAKLHTERDVLLEGNVYPIKGGELTITTGPMRLANQDDLKNFLMSEGWVPTLFNFKRDERGKPARDERGNIILTTPKLQENGRLCPNLEGMAGDMVRPVVRWLSLRNRKSVIEGWLGNERLEYDGRLSAGASGYTPTFRKKHSTVVNLPKADNKVIYGTEVRSLFYTPRPGYVLVGYDASGLEARVEAHYTMDYPGGKEYAHELIDGDIHLKTAERIFSEMVLPYKNDPDYGKEHHVVKVWRGNAKNRIKYPLTYGAQAKKIASVNGVSIDKAQEWVDGFWETAKPLAIFRDRLTQHWEQNDKKWIRGLDKRRIMTRMKHALVNSAQQSAGAIIFQYATLFMHKWLDGLVVDSDNVLAYNFKSRFVYPVAEMHDEALWEVPEELADEFRELGEKSLSEAGKYLKVKVPILGEGKVGDTWADCH